MTTAELIGNILFVMWAWSLLLFVALTIRAGRTLSD